MALFNTGSLVVSGGTGGGTKTNSFAELKASAAKVIGGENQQYLLDLAGEGILKGIDVVNMRNVYRFGSEQGTDTTLVDGTEAYAIPAGTFAIQDVQLIDVNSKPFRTLEYVPWGQFNNLTGKQTAEGIPEFWTARNSFDDQTITLYPEPETQAAAKYTLRITYYERIARPASNSDVIDAPRELSECLVTYAEYYLLRTRNRDDPHAYMERKRAFDEQLAQYIESTEREPSENLQWVMGPQNYNSGRGYDPLS